MSWANYDDVVAQLRAAGLVIDKDLLFDARIQRWRVENEDRERRGWTRLKEWTSRAGRTYIVGAFGVWHGTDDGYTRIEITRDESGKRLSDEDLAAIRASQKETARRLKEERKREAKTAAAWAAMVWSGSAPCTDHEYLARKGVRAHGLRILESLDGIPLPDIDESNEYRLTQAIGALVVPMHDPHGNVCGVQFVYPRGHARARKIERDKEFWPAGMAMGGTFGVIGSIHRAGILLVTEGYATAASLHEATGQSVAYAFSAGNLITACKLLRKQYPRLRMLICADDDYVGKCRSCQKLTPVAGGACVHCGAAHGKENAGLKAAVDATAAIELTAWIKPDFRDSDGNDLRAGKKLTDYNDLAQMTGLTLALADQINGKLDDLQWREKLPGGGAPQSGGAGEDDSRRARSVMPLDDLVARFTPLDDGTGKHVFDLWTNKIAHKDQMIALLPPGLRLDDIKRHPLWVRRGAYFLDEVGFDPGESDQRVRLNTWRGWPITPANGKCDRLLELIEYLCNAEENGPEVYRWLLKWMAYPLQHPGAKMNSAVIMHGPQGTGKSTVFQVLARIYGDYATVLNQRGLEDRFNADWVDSKLFILAEEVVTRAEMWHIKNELKELVTGEWIRVNPKNIGAYRQRNHVNIVYLSNENQPLPIENDDRRHCVIWTPPAVSEAFYDDVWLEIEQGATEAFYAYLMGLDLTGFHPKKRPPMTDAKRQLIDLSLPSEIRFINDWAGGDTPWPVSPCLAADFYAVYLRWCRLNGESRPRPSNQFHGAVGRLPGWSKKKTRVYDNPSCAGQSAPKPVIVPPDTVLQAAGNAQPPGEDATAWLTRCCIRFSNACGRPADDG